jgi:hypothetical protein
VLAGYLVFNSFRYVHWRCGVSRHSDAHIQKVLVDSLPLLLSGHQGIAAWCTESVFGLAKFIATAETPTCPFTCRNNGKNTSTEPASGCAFKEGMRSGAVHRRESAVVDPKSWARLGSWIAEEITCNSRALEWSQRLSVLPLFAGHTSLRIAGPLATALEQLGTVGVRC